MGIHLTNICLIGGSGRSGTTILKRVFGRHPAVAAMPEWRGTIDPDGLVDFLAAFESGWSPYGFDVKQKRLGKLLRDIGRYHPVLLRVQTLLRGSRLVCALPVNPFPRYTDIDLRAVCPDYGALVDRLLARLTAFRYRASWTGQGFLDRRNVRYHGPFADGDLAGILGEFLRSVMESAARSQGAAHVVEDNTWNILWFDKLLRLLPEAKLVHIYRDPRDVVASYTTQSWMPADPVKSAHVLRDVLLRWAEVRRGLPAGSFMEISLDSLVADPRRVLTALCAFWGMEWHEALLDTDLGGAHVGRWRQDLKPESQKAVCALLRDVMDAYGYSDQ